MGPRRRIHVIGEPRRVFEHLLRGRHLAVQDAQRVRRQAAAAVGIQGFGVGGKVFHQSGAVGGTRRAGAERVDLQRHLAVDAERAPRRLRQLHQFGFHGGTANAERFHANLLELTIAPTLLSLIAEHRPGIPEPLCLVAQQAMFDGGPGATGGALRAQREFAAAPIPQRVHLLFHDVRRFADAAAEELGRLDERQPDLLVAKGLRDGRDGIRDPARQRSVGTHEVPHAAHGFVGHGAHSSTKLATRLRVCGPSATAWPSYSRVTPGALPIRMRNGVSPCNKSVSPARFRAR